MSKNEPPDHEKTPFRVIASNDQERQAKKDEEPFAANDEALLIRIAHLEQDHRDLNMAIEALETQPRHDRLSVARLKKKKLQLKDELQKLKNSLTPDIIA